MTVFIDIYIFKSDLTDIDINIDIFKMCRYIDNRYGLSIYRTPLDLPQNTATIRAGGANKAKYKLYKFDL